HDAICCLSDQTFSYLIVIDFESTCWREKNNYSQEIIEFPAVLLNTSTGEVESEFHAYVQPQEHPVLSEFCTELTGITQMQVESGIPLQICLSRFNRWLQNLQFNMGVIFPNKQPIPPVPSASQKLCTFLTWSDWDLGVCLQYECKRKQLHKPDVLNSWIDLRSTYRLFYSRKPKGLNGALQDLGIQFAGREHSGLDDARNTAQLAARMMRDGCVMKITRSLVRTPSMVKPMFGETTADNKKQKLNADKEENTLTTNKIPPKSCRMKSFSKLFTRDLDTKENSGQESAESRQSLVSRKTLLNGTIVLGGRSFTKKAATNISCNMVMRNSLSANNNNDNNLVLCSTTVGCLSNQPQVNQPYKKAATAALLEEEEGAEVLLAETEDRCGSYDDVVLGGDNEVITKPSYPSSGGSFCTSRHVLKSLSTNTLSSRTNCSSASVLMKEGQRITSPLCSCGRRAKRQVVSNGGPNHGRGFYCCPVRRSASGGRVQKGCQFFKWESALIKSNIVTASTVLCHTHTQALLTEL
uniref:ERI1 exoribonuclease 2 n=1 Tax=Mola mola TaxID=94237 RepID=A0A3Q3WZ88_MOLML